MQVKFGQIFAKNLVNFPKSDILKIRAFIKCVEEQGLVGLEGRNKSSDNVPTDDPNWRTKVLYAQKHHLWHYHIGIPTYAGMDGDKTSEYVLHYIKETDYIKIVDMSAHPPFELPSENYLI